MSNQSDELLALSSDVVMYAARMIRAVRQDSSPDVPLAGIRVMASLDEHGPLGVSQLARLERCSQPTMSATVTMLEARGWVTKSPRPEDARATLVDFTDAGRAALAGVRRTHAQLIADRLTNHTEHGVDDLATTVAVLRDLVGRYDPEGPQ